MSKKNGRIKSLIVLLKAKNIYFINFNASMKCSRMHNAQFADIEDVEREMENTLLRFILQCGISCYVRSMHLF